MNADSVISVRGLSKAYNLYERPRDILLEAVLGGVRHDTFWALRDIDLEIYEGQRVGIVGPNGAGKSTLLKILTGNLAPTSGNVQVNGSVSAMLSLTSFLNPDQTGLENIRFNLILNGTDSRRIPELTEEIIDFTELGAFIKAPVRTYSSGMNARLSFAISTAITPDILVVDEVLGAGDAYFASKATVRMMELCRQGRALLFVSHAMSAVQMLCDTAIWLDNGQIREIGPVEEIGRRYEADFRRQEDEHLRPGNAVRAVSLANIVLPEELGRPDVWRLRVIPPSGRIHDTHYVGALSVSIGNRTIDVPLEFVDIDDSGVVACLDIAASEWARIHDRHGVTTRVLAQGSSMLRGGHLLLRVPSGIDVASHDVTVAVTSTSVGRTEALTVQTADARSGRWVDLERIGSSGEGEWTTTTFRGALAPRSAVPAEGRIEHIAEITRPDVEIADVRLLVGGEMVLSMTEDEPFAIEVEIHATREVPLADVWIKFTRADGFYVFWQSSGQADCNLRNLSTGDHIVTFHIQPNLFGAGDYEVEAVVANGFDVETNWPHSQVYDRRVNALKFTVARRWKLLMFGPVNYRFPVTVAPKAAQEALRDL